MLGECNQQQGADVLTPDDGTSDTACPKFHISQVRTSHVRTWVVRLVYKMNEGIMKLL